MITYEFCQYKIIAETETGSRVLHYSSVIKANTSADKKAERNIKSCFRTLVGREPLYFDVQKQKRLYTKLSIVKSYGYVPAVLFCNVILDKAYVMTHILNRSERRIFGSSKIESKL